TGVIDTLAGRAELQVLATGDGGFPAAVLERVRNVRGVEVAAPILARAAMLRAEGDWVRVTVWGIDPELDLQVRPVHLAAGPWHTRGGPHCGHGYRGPPDIPCSRRLHRARA